eukprot:CAMPEP_0116847326 /NCGR_PEP_ID=MMETSP0418-20121206/14372_1 /TAXON_ID=1158023 /ORGANISM="Astrosyne radiata, Strain 13vi08-1A" /LENGTH=61 /DNA_ID=CAMNT_0004478759 /DNA_START=149 /DNA_END=330 /DNA_ORIENTATION=-
MGAIEPPMDWRVAVKPPKTTLPPAKTASIDIMLAAQLPALIPAAPKPNNLTGKMRRAAQTA